MGEIEEAGGQGRPPRRKVNGRRRARAQEAPGNRAQREIDRLEKFGSGSRTQGPDLEGTRRLYREMRDRFGSVLDGGRGAAAIQKRWSPST